MASSVTHKPPLQKQGPRHQNGPKSEKSLAEDAVKKKLHGFLGDLLRFGSLKVNINFFEHLAPYKQYFDRVGN